MRIAMVNWSSRRVGGAETYLEIVMRDLRAAGHAVSLWHEMATPSERPEIALPPDVPRWDASKLGVDRATHALRDWQPDVTLTHGVRDHAMHAPVLAVAPAVYFAHTYYGTCISGHKTWKSPRPVPCSRTLGPPCLLHYYPHRCGGLSPVTMVRDYRRQRLALAVLRNYQAIVVASDQMRAEYIAHGFSPQRVHRAPYYLPGSDMGAAADDEQLVTQSPQVPAVSAGPRRIHDLIFLGRMDVLKGGAFLLRALPGAAQRLGACLRLVMIGDGPARAAWEDAAARVRAKEDRVEIIFTGWLDHADIMARMRNAHLLVVPSVWPEPFGIVGLEAGNAGVPAVAFDVGGISDWLHHGVNGRLASGDPPTIEGLANEIAASVSSPSAHLDMRRAARHAVRAFNSAAHLDTLLHALSEARTAARENPVRDRIMPT